MDIHSVILPIVCPQRGTKLYRYILSRRNPNLDEERLRGCGGIEVQHDASVDFGHGSSNVATHYRALEDFLQGIPVLSIVL